MKKKLKVLLLFDSPFYAPRGYDFKKEFKELDWSVEDGVYRALKQCGYDITLMGIHDDIRVLVDEVQENRPDVVFSLAEVFNQRAELDKNIAWLLEMLGVPYTGASPASLLVCNNKALTKQILSFLK